MRITSPCGCCGSGSGSGSGALTDCHPDCTRLASSLCLTLASSCAALDGRTITMPPGTPDFHCVCGWASDLSAPFDTGGGHVANIQAAFSAGCDATKPHCDLLTVSGNCDDVDAWVVSRTPDASGLDFRTLDVRWLSTTPGSSVGVAGGYVFQLNPPAEGCPCPQSTPVDILITEGACP